MKISTIFIALALAIVPVSGFAHRPIDNEDYARHTFVDSSNRRMPYRMLSPQIKEGEKYPLVIFLHGSGERGSDNEKQLVYGASTFSIRQM